MRYLGGKHLIGEKISDFLFDHFPPSDVDGYLEPFCGSLGVFKYMTRTIQGQHYRSCIASDIQPDIIQMWREAKDGTLIIPKTMNKTIYDELKKSGSNSCGQGDSLKAIVGFFLSFGGKYFGGYAQQWEPKEGGKNYLQSFRHSLEKIVPMIQHEYVSFQCRSYEEWTPTIMGKQKCLIYCDPPYKGTEGYGATIPFEHERFWKTMREWSKKHIVIISEEHAPSDFQSIWSCKKKRKLSSNKQKRLVKREHLFIYGSVGKKYTKRRGEKYRKTIKRN